MLTDPIPSGTTLVPGSLPSGSHLPPAR
ncbi:hypothetical protein [Paenibacillus sp. FSL K6-1230]